MSKVSGAAAQPLYNPESSINSKGFFGNSLPYRHDAQRTMCGAGRLFHPTLTQVTGPSSGSKSSAATANPKAVAALLM